MIIQLFQGFLYLILTLSQITNDGVTAVEDYLMYIETPTQQITKSIAFSSFQMIIIQIDASRFNYIDAGQDLFNLLVSGTKVKSIGSPLTVESWKIYNYGSNDTIIQLKINATNYTTQIRQSIFVDVVIQSPSRADYGTPNQFAAVVSSSLLSNYILPFNFPSTTSSIIIDKVDINIPETYQQPPFDSFYWSNQNGISTLALPWFPFFSQCQNYGRHLYMFDVFELSQNCTLVDPSNVQIASTIPTNGITTIADSCNLLIPCFYEENMTAQYGASLWFQSQGDILYYLKNQPMDVQTLLDLSTDANFPTLANMVNDQSDELIPVAFYTNGILSNSIPNEFLLDIKYNQISQTQKKIVSASVTAVGYAQQQADMNSYMLRISFKPMNYLEMINAFQFGTPIYLVLFILLGTLTVLGIFIIWLINNFVSNVFTNVQHPPKLRLVPTFIVAFVPAIVGSLLATIPIILYLYIMKQLVYNGLFSFIPYKYDPSVLTSADQISTDKGRTGLMIMVTGLLLVKIGCGLMIDKPTEEDLEALKMEVEKHKHGELESKQDEEDVTDHKEEEYKNLMRSAKGLSPSRYQHKNSSESIHQFNKSPDPETENLQEHGLREKKQINEEHEQEEEANEIEEQTQEEEGEEEENLEEEIALQLSYKSFHFQTISLFLAFFLLYLLGFSYMKIFQKNIFYFLILLQVFDVAVFSYCLSKYLLNESLLIQPLLACLDLFYFVIFMAAETLQDFIISYMIRMCLIIFFRTYITPILKNLEFFMRKFLTWASQEYPWILPYVQKQKLFQFNFSDSYLVSSLQDQKIRFYMNSNQDEMTEFKQEQSQEHVITMVLQFSSKMHAIFLKPFVLVIIKFFDHQTQIPKLYNIEYGDFVYYIYFAFVFIFPQVIIDIYVLNSLELIYGYKLYDYFHYCKYRFDSRQPKKITTFDQSIQPEHRSIDNEKFTPMFYFKGTVVIYGIVCVVIGTTVIIQNQFRVFEDPIVTIQVLMFSLLLFLLKSVIQYVWNKFDPWKVKTPKAKHNLDSVDEFLNPVKENLESMMEVDLIRKTFIKLNKEWLINNLNLFVTPETFLENDEYLLRLYEKMLNEVKRDEIETKRLQILQKKQKSTQTKGSGKVKVGAGEINNNDKSFASDHIQDDSLQNNLLEQNPQELIIRITRTQADSLQKILSLWYYKARQNLYLKSLVNEIIESMLEEHCKRCGIDIELRVVEQVSFSKMCNIFKFKCIGEPFNKIVWRQFYKKNQKFITLCLDCEINYRNRLQEKQKKEPDMKEIQDKIKEDNLDDEQVQIIRNTKSLMLCWLMRARSQLIFQKDD